MRDNFESKLESLNRNMTAMADTVCDQLKMAVAALLAKDKEKADFVIAHERTVNADYTENERDALMLLLREQPAARDFRFVSAAINMNTDLERVGDQAEDIAVLVKQMIDTGYDKPNLGSIERMSTITQHMLTDAVQAFVAGDSELARQAAMMDDMVDELFVKVRDEIVQDIRQEQVEPDLIIDLLMIAKYLERCGDHAQNIAESVLFSLTGAREKFD